MVRFFLLQGKPSRTKTRLTTISKPTTKRPKNIPLDRKENLVQPSSSKSTLRLNKCFKTRSRKDLTLKTKNITTDKSKTTVKAKKMVPPPVIPQKVKMELPAKVPNVKEQQAKENDSIHLREICFIKNDEGKTVIAKYDNAEFDDDSLVVSWDKTASKAQIYTHKTRVSSAPPYVFNKDRTVPSTSKQTGSFRVHNFIRNKSIAKKFKNHNLRRLASAADVLGKMEKKPKKKMKSK